MSFIWLIILRRKEPEVLMENSLGIELLLDRTKYVSSQLPYNEVFGGLGCFFFTRHSNGVEKWQLLQ